MLLRMHGCSFPVIDRRHNNIGIFFMYILHDFRKFLRLLLFKYMSVSHCNLTGSLLCLSDPAYISKINLSCCASLYTAKHPLLPLWFSMSFKFWEFIISWRKSTWRWKETEISKSEVGLLSKKWGWDGDLIFFYDLFNASLWLSLPKSLVTKTVIYRFWRTRSLSYSSIMVPCPTPFLRAFPHSEHLKLLMTDPWLNGCQFLFLLYAFV